MTAQFFAPFSDFPGVPGAYFCDLGDGEAHSLNPDEPFPGASVMKVPLLVELARLANLGELDLTERVMLPLDQPEYRSTDSSGILTHLTTPIALSILDLCTLMIIESDNIATNLLYDRAPQVNATLAALGLRQTRVTHPIVDFVRLRADDANPITAREMGELYAAIHRRTLPNSALLFEILREQHSESLIPAYLRDEEGVTFAHKTGGVQGVMHDTGLVLTERFAYVLCLLTKRGTNKVETTRLMATTSQNIYDYMQKKWRAAPTPNGQHI